MALSTARAMKHLQGSNLVELDDVQLKDLQGCILSIADDVIGLCETYSIAYNLGGGSALGAVRHGGFIPWDDDMDIDMPREDFERFKDIFDDILGDRYWLHAPGVTEDYGLIIGRVRLKGTCLRVHGDGDEECGVFLDIFIKENTYNNPVLRLLHGLGSQFFGLMVSCGRFHLRKAQYLALAGSDTALRRTVKAKAAIGKLGAWRSQRQWDAAADRWNSQCGNIHSKYVTVPGGKRHFFGEMRPRDMFGAGLRMQFEGRRWLVPAQFDAYLADHYGPNYMEAPKGADREKHAYLEFDLGEKRVQTNQGEEEA